MYNGEQYMLSAAFLTFSFGKIAKAPAKNYRIQRKFKNRIDTSCESC